MTGKIVELFPDADMERLARQIRRWRTALCILAAAALAACVCMAAAAGTANADRMEIAAIIVSTFAGWIVIYCAIFVVTARRRELAHAAMLRTEDRQRVEGTVAVTDERFTIRKSVAVRRVEVCGDEERRLLVCDSRAAALAASGAVAVYTAHGYVAAYEVKA